MNYDSRVDTYIDALPDWQQEICNRARKLIHAASPDIEEEIKFTNRPYFTHRGNVCAILAAKDHVNIFIYDPIASDHENIVNQGHGNQTARSIQIYEGQFPDEDAFTNLIREVVLNNKNGGWRKLLKQRNITTGSGR